MTDYISFPIILSICKEVIMQNIKAPIVLVVLFILISSCATSIHVKVLKPAEVNMSGTRKLAIFTVDVPQKGIYQDADNMWKDLLKKIKIKKIIETSEMEYRIGEYATDTLIAYLADTNYFEIISPTDVERSLEYYDASDIDPIMLGSLLGAEAIILSEITDLDEDIEKYIVIETHIDKKTKKEYEVEVPWVRKTVHLRFTYWVISTVTDRLIATKSFTQSAKHQVEAKSDAQLRSSEEMYKQIITGNLKTVAKQLAPYEVWEARYMMKDETKDDRMEQADNLVKGNIYDKALDLFLEIWYDNQNPAAGVNAAIMYEVMGDVDTAIKLIEEVLDVSADKKVMTEYNRLKRVKEEQLKVAEQMGES